MRSLFLRLLVSMWLTMTLLVGVFALIHASTFPDEPGALRKRFEARSVELRAEHALLCARDRLADCDAVLGQLDPRDQRIALYRGGELVMGRPIDGGAALEEDAHRSTDGVATSIGEGAQLTAVVVRRDPSVVAVATGQSRSPWVFFFVPETLPYRLLAIFAVTGIVSALLARYLSRPVRVLRLATQQMAAGDLSVRVTNELAGADGETLALGREMDRMAERIQELLESQRRLLRDVSHELRSPLARLGIALELVRRRSPPDVEPAFDRIERETERLNEMIGELLTLSRLEAEEALERPARVDLSALVEAVGEDAAFEAERHGCKVEVRAAGGCALDGNEELLRRAVENLLRNGIRFTEPGTSIEVDLERDGQGAELRVRDHGPGVPEESLERIFEPFYRVGDDRARSSGGTGIGLAITRRAALLHGGTVTAKNADGGGLVVTLRLPLRARGEAAATRP